MDRSLQLFSENLLVMMRGALMMLFVGLCLNLYPRRAESSILNYLFWMLVVMSFFLLVSFGSMIDELKESVHYCNFKILTDRCLVPLLGTFLLKIMIPNGINPRRTLLLLTPMVIFMLIYTFTNNRLMFSLSFTYSIIVVVVVLLFVVYLSVRYDHYVKNNFSDIDNKTVTWVRRVVYFFFAWIVIWELVVKTNIRWIDSVYYLFMIVLWIFIYRYSIRHVAVVNMHELFQEAIREPVFDESIGFHAITTDKLSAKIEHYMNTERPWLNPSLTLQDLAFSLRTNRTYLSEYFNKTMNTNFYDYFNNFRVTYSCEKLLSDENLTLVQISEMSGFNSLSTFRRAFQKRLGCTPAQYRKQELN